MGIPYYLKGGMIIKTMHRPPEMLKMSKGGRREVKGGEGSEHARGTRYIAGLTRYALRDTIEVRGGKECKRALKRVMRGLGFSAKEKAAHSEKSPSTNKTVDKHREAQSARRR